MEKQKMDMKKFSIFSISGITLVFAIISIVLVLRIVSGGTTFENIVQSKKVISSIELVESGDLTELEEFKMSAPDATFIFIKTPNESKYFVKGKSLGMAYEHTMQSSMETLLQITSASSDAYAIGCPSGQKKVCGNIIVNGELTNKCWCE